MFFAKIMNMHLKKNCLYFTIDKNSVNLVSSAVFADTKFLLQGLH